MSKLNQKELDNACEIGIRKRNREVVILFMIISILVFIGFGYCINDCLK